MTHRKHTVKSAARPTREQQQTADTLRAVYADEFDLRLGTRQRLTLYLNRLLEDTGTPKKGRPRHELYLLAIGKLGDEADASYPADMVLRLARDAREEHARSTRQQLRSRLAVTYTGKPNAENTQMIDALLDFARLNLTLLPEGLDLAQTIYDASRAAWFKSRRQYKDGRLPGVLDEAMRVVHIKVHNAAVGKSPAAGYTPDFIERGERGLAQWYGGTALDTKLDPGEFAEEAGETPTRADDAPAPVVDLNLWAQSHPRRVRSLLFAKGGRR